MSIGSLFLLTVLNPIFASDVLEVRLGSRLVTSMRLGDWMRGPMYQGQSITNTDDRTAIRLLVNEMERNKVFVQPPTMKEEAKTKGQHAAGVVSGFASFTYEGFQKAPVVVGVSAAATGVGGGAAGYYAG